MLQSEASSNPTMQKRESVTVPLEGTCRASRLVATGERGIALVVVLWGIAVLALIAAALSSEINAQVTLTRNLIGNAQAEALADGGVFLAIAQLSDPATAGTWVLNGPPKRIELPGGSVAIAIEDESAKIDLNRAPDAILRGLFVAVGMDSDAAAALVDKIGDYRDPDSLNRLHGAEDSDYSSHALAGGAKDGPFEKIEELQQIPGVTRELYDRLSPALTVHSGQRQINIAHAPELVLRSLPHFNSDQVAELLSHRNENQGSMLLNLRVAVLKITGMASTEDGARFVRTAIVQRSADARNPYVIRSWDRGPAALGSTDQAGNQPPAVQ